MVWGIPKLQQLVFFIMVSVPGQQSYSGGYMMRTPGRDGI